MKRWAAVAANFVLASARPRAGQHVPRGLADLPDQLAKRVAAEPSFLPADATGVKSFVTPTNVTIRYKEPGKHGVCETTEGVNSYSGYVDLDEQTHVFFWFFESRRNPEKDPITLWLNGGPGSDSLYGLLEENGPCRVMEKDGKYVTVTNPNSWNEVSNMLYISQPVGVGFSYQTSGVGALSNTSDGGLGTFLAPDQVADGDQKVTGRWPVLLPTEEGSIGTSGQAAVATWHVLQGFLSGLNTLAPGLGSPKGKGFNFATESYGGHYGPAFFDYFYQQNQAILNGSASGIPLTMDTLTIINGIIDYSTQAQYYPKFAVNNSYGIKIYNETVYNYAMFANSMVNGCQDQISACQVVASSIKGGYQGYFNQSALLSDISITDTALRTAPVAYVCAGAQYMCEDNVEYPFLAYGDRNVYDIRAPADSPTPPDILGQYLNQPEVREALGVNLNWTGSNYEIYVNFHSHGDGILTNHKRELERILDSGVRVALLYGDADYICNELGGEAVSLALNYSHATEFAKAGYQPFLVDGYQYGETREYGNLSFTRVYESGHMIPYYQPLASLQMLNRTINLLDMPNGVKRVTEHLESHGPLKSTKTHPLESFPPESSTSAFAAYATKEVNYYNALFTQTAPPKATASA